MFWRELHDQVLLSMAPGSGIEKFQVEALSSKILVICQQDEDTSVEEGLMQLASAYPICLRRGPWGDAAH